MASPPLLRALARVLTHATLDEPAHDGVDAVLHALLRLVPSSRR
ncbi:hypothetical protein [Streptomyces sp. NPDC018833]